jgi:hypothetical protein
MRKRWAEITVVVLLVLPGQMSLLYWAVYMRGTAATASRNQQALALEMSVLNGRVLDLTNEADKWKARAEEAEKAAIPMRARESRREMSEGVNAEAAEILDFENEKEANRPPMILAAVPGGDETMRRNQGDLLRYENGAVRDFIKLFGGRVNDLIRRVRPYGIDTSRCSGT